MCNTGAFAAAKTAPSRLDLTAKPIAPLHYQPENDATAPLLAISVMSANYANDKEQATGRDIPLVGWCRPNAAAKFYSICRSSAARRALSGLPTVSELFL